MFVAALVTVAQTVKEPKCASADDWIRRMWRTFARGHYSTLKKNGILPFATMWTNLQGITLSESTQKRKTTTM